MLARIPVFPLRPKGLGAVARVLELHRLGVARARVIGQEPFDLGPQAFGLARQHGERLELPLTGDGQAICPATGRAYLLHQGMVTLAEG